MLVSSSFISGDAQNMSLDLVVNQQCIVTTELIGNEKIPVVVIDNWLLNPEELKKFPPQTLEKWVEPSTLFPGLWAKVPDTYIPALMNTLAPFIKQNFNIHQEKPEHIFSCYGIITKAPEELHYFQTAPHFDTLETPQIAVVHYLCDEGHGGTSFYRHKRTGYETITKERWDGYRKILEHELLQYPEKSPQYIDDSNEYFEKIKECAVKFDRLLIYPGEALHSGLVRIPHTHASDITSDRLTITSFISYY